MTSCQSNPLHTFAGKAYNKEVFYSRSRYSDKSKVDGRITVEREFVDSNHRPTQVYPRTVAVLQDKDVNSVAGKTGVRGSSWLSEFQQFNLDTATHGPNAISRERPFPTTQVNHSQFNGSQRFIGNDSLFKFQDNPIIDRMSPQDLEAFYEKEFGDIEDEFDTNWSDDDMEQSEDYAQEENVPEENKTYEYYNEFAFQEQQTFQDSARDILKNVSETKHEYSDDLNDRLSGSQFMQLLKNIETGDITLRPNEKKPHELLDKNNNQTVGHNYVEIPDDTK
ncbi:hypothetical protein RNJ44_02513 [Nakaseomyces bracarensis]|uniref:PEX18/PEX21 C-terminal domain-containing protein n=1 Tax=Nakaseomyces bracarensis TaxID=273131 RepID=A0ABR4NLX7_9SACH